MHLNSQVWAGCCLLLFCGCSSADAAYTEAPWGPPSYNSSNSSNPTTPPPTGEKWSETTVEDSCGRTSIQYTLVDEMCGGTSAPGYLSSLRAPMFRDGVRVGEHLYAVDGTLLWGIGLDGAKFTSREVLIPGLGQPLAIRSWENSLLIASGEAGLLQMDVTNPTSPVLTHKLALPGPALALDRTGNVVYVALGSEGLAIVDLEASGPHLRKVLPFEWPSTQFAVGVHAQDGLAYVAACSGLAIFDIRQQQQISSSWALKNAPNTPIKGVAMIDQIAFVAAGHAGAVAVDVSDPQHPRELGACRPSSEPSFYVSGVRTQGNTLFMAAGEWGVGRASHRDPSALCTASLEIDSPTPQQDACPPPPWVQIPWSSSVQIPPTSKDPVQVFPWGGLLYAFGDARRLGVRAINAHNADTLKLLNRYEEPHKVSGIAAQGERVMVLGEAGGFFKEDPQSGLSKQGNLPAGLESATAGNLLSDGRWVLALDRDVHIEGGVILSGERAVEPHTLAARGTQVALGSSTKYWWYDASTGQPPQAHFSPLTAVTPPAIAIQQGGVFLAAPEWLSALWLPLNGEPESQIPHGVFSREQLEDPIAWKKQSPRRLLISAGDEVLELASLGVWSGIKKIGKGTRLTLPSADYSAAIYSEGRAYLVGLDRASYTSILVTLEDSNDGLKLLETRFFLGQAVGIAASSHRIYVADRDAGVRMFERGEHGTEPAGIVSLEGVQ